MLGRGGQRDAFEVRPLFLIVKKKGHLLADVNGEAAEHRSDRRRERVEFLEREGEGDFLFDRDWLSHKWRGYDLYGLASGTVQGAVATWRHRKRLLRKRQVATAPC